VDNSGDTARALATWCNWTRWWQLDPFTVGHSSSGPRHQSVDRTARSLTLQWESLWALAFEESANNIADFQSRRRVPFNVTESELKSAIGNWKPAIR
jgi:hypothetical protein